MSARFWLFSMASAGAALAGGLGLGVYATTSPRPAWAETALPERPATQAGYEIASTDLIGPTVVHCKGCGPTLADRQMAADMAGWDGMNDPLVRDYVAQDDAAPGDEAQLHGMQPDHADLPAPSIDRFVADAAGASVQQVRIAQFQTSKTSAENVPADAALSY